MAGRRAILLIFITAVIGLSCSDSVTVGDYDEPLKLNGVRYVSPDSADNPNQIGPGDVVVLEGENMNSVSKVFFNDYEAVFNPVLATDTTLIVTVPADMPFGAMDPEAEYMNTIKVSNNNSESILEFPVLPPRPQISSVSNEFAEPGETIRISGQYLYLVKKVEFPGQVTAANFEFAPDGSWLTVKVPGGVNKAGHITITTSSGSSPATYANMFNDKTGIFINFDDKNPFVPWGTTPVVTNSYANIQPLDGNYIHWQLADVPVPLWWSQELATPLEGIDWSSVKIPDSESLANLALKMEINIPAGLNSGKIQFQVNWEYNYEWSPWLQGSGDSKERITIQTDGWQTFTIPLGVFLELGASTLSDIKKNWYITYINPDTGVPVELVDLAFDNFRIVKMN